MTRFAFAAIIMVWTAASVHAQSFDCRQAKTVIETTICDNRDLAALDYEMEGAFRKALKGTGRLHAAMMSDQRAWRKDRDADCAKLAEDRGRMAACIADYYKARLVELQRPH